MTSEAATQPQPAPLPERVQQVLDATAGADTTQEWILHGPTLKGDFWLYSPREPLPGEQIAPGSEPINLIAETMGLHDARLIAAAPDLRALLAETAAALAAAQAERDALRAALERAEGDLTRERSTHSGTIDQRDTAQEAADRLAYALFSIDEIGEHSSSNCPWENAAERLEEMAALGGQS